MSTHSDHSCKTFVADSLCRHGIAKEKKWRRVDSVCMQEGGSAQHAESEMNCTIAELWGKNG